MPLGAILDVIFDRNWMYRVDKKELATIFGVERVKIELQPEFYPPKTYSYKDENTGRILFMASRMSKNSGLNMIKFLNKNEKGIVKNMEFDVFPGDVKSFRCQVEDNQIYLILIKNKTIHLTGFDGQPDNLLRAAKHFEEKKIF